MPPRIVAVVMVLQRKLHETRHGLGLATVNCNLAIHPTEPIGELQVDLMFENRTDVALAYLLERATTAMDGGPPLSWSGRPGLLALHAPVWREERALDVMRA